MYHQLQYIKGLFGIISHLTMLQNLPKYDYFSIFVIITLTCLGSHCRVLTQIYQIFHNHPQFTTINDFKPIILKTVTKNKTCQPILLQQKMPLPLSTTQRMSRHPLPHGTNTSTTSRGQKTEAILIKARHPARASTFYYKNVIT